MNVPSTPSSLSSSAITESAVRGALERRRRSASRLRCRAGGSASPVPSARSASAGRGALRRWSVADLIARGVPRPASGRVAHP